MTSFEPWEVCARSSWWPQRATPSGVRDLAWMTDIELAKLGRLQVPCAWTHAGPGRLHILLLIGATRRYPENALEGNLGDLAFLRTSPFLVHGLFAVSGPLTRVK